MVVRTAAFLAIFGTAFLSLQSPSQAQPADPSATPPAATGHDAAAPAGNVTATSTGSGGERSVTEAIGLTAGTDGGFGFSMLTNVSRFFMNGNYDVLSAGIGFGVSWKNKSNSRFPFELGGYLAPQLSGEGSTSTGSLAMIIHATIEKGFGVGVGATLWQKGVGFGGGTAGERVFLTLGYGITNDTKNSGP